MDAPGTTTQTADRERDHLARAHHEICTALTVLRSNVELVRIELRDTALPENGVPVRAHLDELDTAVDRLRGLAAEMKRWHAAASPEPPPASADRAPRKVAASPAQGLGP